MLKILFKIDRSCEFERWTPTFLDYHPYIKIIWGSKKTSHSFSMYITFPKIENIKKWKIIKRVFAEGNYISSFFGYKHYPQEEKLRFIHVLSFYLPPFLFKLDV